MTNAYKILVKTPDGKRPFRRPRHGWEDLNKTGCECVDWIQLPQDTIQWRALVSMVMNFLASFSITPLRGGSC
jgi:hypothetical protein